MELKEMLLLAPFVSPVLALLIQAIKQVLTEKLLKFLPLLSVVLGILISVVVNFGWDFGLNIHQALVIGTYLGLGATGFYEIAKQI